jgi:hypothetical protein
MPPSLLLRNLSSSGADSSLSPGDHAFLRRRGANKLRIGGFICCTGSPGVWGPCATNSAQLAVAEINKRGGILGREIELSIYDAGGPLDEVLNAPSRRSRSTRSISSSGCTPARSASACATSPRVTASPTSIRRSTKAASARPA